MEIKTIKIGYEWWEMVVEVNVVESTMRSMEEQLLFWMSGKGMIEQEDGDVLKAYIKMLGNACLNMSSTFSATGIVKELGNSEGWGKLDGSAGVKITSVDSWEFDENELSISGLN